MSKPVVALLGLLLLGLSTAHAEPPVGRRWAVVIGVQDYNDSLFRRLEYSTHDAQLFVIAVYHDNIHYVRRATDRRF